MRDRCGLGYYPFPERRFGVSALKNFDSQRRKRTAQKGSFHISGLLDSLNEEQMGVRYSVRSGFLVELICINFQIGRD
jgi:hypothetical protein